mmetsp:Transcript_27016/g.38047  ORF Transcript_27016/g.38047 Transcript_27016/m.38047 type:complete len:159 (+) Transcript_27016:95-571(+)
MEISYNPTFLLTFLVVTLLLLSQNNGVHGLASFVNPSMTPETVVEYQLKALQQEDLQQVFEYASPSNKAVTGPWERFAQMVRSPAYAPLIGHGRGDVLLSIKVKTNDTYRRFLVRIWSPKTSAESISRCIEYWWDVRKCIDEGPYQNCWMVESVVPRK